MVRTLLHVAGVFELLSRFYSVPYLLRALSVLMAFGVIALWDRLRQRHRATRWREYAFWIACACIGGVFGVVNDALTSTVSKAYFVIGKGLPDDPQHFSAAVMTLGAQAGSFAGTVVGGVFLVANNPARHGPRLRYRELTRYLAIVMLTAIVLGIAMGGFSTCDVQRLAPVLRDILPEREVQRFLAIQRVHVGLYLGAALATLASAAMIRSARRALTARVP